MSHWKVTIQKVHNFTPIENADRIEVAHVLGWKCVVKKGDFEIGDMGVYIPLDSEVPHDEDRYPFMKGSKYRVRTVKLRGQISQGLFLPMDFFTSQERSDIDKVASGEDISQTIGVTQYEPQMSAKMNVASEGYIPSIIKRTDQERLQNIPEIINLFQTNTFEMSEKLNGSSVQMYLYEGGLKVCSRNMLLKNVKGSAHWAIAEKYGVEEKLRSFSRNISLQGELVGPKIQGNPYKLNEIDWYIFDIWDVDEQKYILPAERQAIISYLGLKHVPIWDDALVPYDDMSVDDFLKLSDGMSVMNPEAVREGLVYKSMDYIDGEIVSFKVVNNELLLEVTNG